MIGNFSAATRTLPWELRVNFEVARKPKVLLGTVAATEDNAAKRLATLYNLARSRW